MTHLIHTNTHGLVVRLQVAFATELDAIAHAIAHHDYCVATQVVVNTLSHLRATRHAH